ncbi:MAG: extracellular solute-binding protein [Candidatus Kerfeldbacteria bacterium]|nr:extracellular solute-binding protein [Candidatus Kerfeldbacteria bacterium]
MTNTISRKLVLFFLIGLPLVSLLGLGCKGGDPAAKEAAKPLSLTWWRVEGDKNDLAKVVADYKSIHPNITVNIELIRAEELESRLLNTLASGEGPDIVSLPNYSLGGWLDKLTPLPPSLTLPFVEMTGLFKKEPTWVLKKNATITPQKVQETFVETVARDAIFDNKIYALPVSLDSLLLFYNRDLLNAAQVSTPPANWTAFKEASQTMTLLDKTGFFIQHGAALGEADNLPYAIDILSALMLQNGTPMTSSDGRSATFAQTIKVSGQEFAPGLDALRFYTDFANPSKETYTWSREQSNAWQLFAAGKVGFVFGYWRDLNNLRTLAPKVNLGVANFPQIETANKPVYFANYYLETVPKQSAHQNEAWDLVQFVTTRAEVINKYLSVSKKPTALRVLVNKQQEDFDLDKPARQLLTAKSWYHGYKPEVMKNSFLNMIRQAASGLELGQAIGFAAGQVGQTLRR